MSQDEFPGDWERRREETALRKAAEAKERAASERDRARRESENRREERLREKKARAEFVPPYYKRIASQITYADGTPMGDDSLVMIAKALRYIYEAQTGKTKEKTVADWFLNECDERNVTSGEKAGELFNTAFFEPFFATLTGKAEFLLEAMKQDEEMAKEQGRTFYSANSLYKFVIYDALEFLEVEDRQRYDILAELRGIKEGQPKPKPPVYNLSEKQILGVIAKHQIEEQKRRRMKDEPKIDPNRTRIFGERVLFHAERIDPVKGGRAAEPLFGSPQEEQKEPQKKKPRQTVFSF